MQLQEITQQVTALSKTVGAFIKQEQNKLTWEDTETKDLNSLVSYVDKEAEKKIVSGLKKILPEAGFIAEEGTETTKGEVYNWIIDPLDGTTNYLHHLPIYSISIALVKNETLQIGVVFEIGMDEMFSAWKGGGAFLNGKQIHVKQTKNLADTLLATGFPYHDFNRKQPFLNLLSEFFEKTRGLRRFGSAATDLAYVACGRFDGFFEYGLNAWDVSAGALLVQEAGGVVYDFNHNNNYIFGGEILACSKAIEPSFEPIVQKHLNIK